MTNPISPLFTIIVAVFNGVKTLQQCIDSISYQTYSNIQLIIIDGGSVDGTVSLLKANDSAISYWVSEPDSGVYNAWNKALLKAEGDWICFLGADDYFWDQYVLENIRQALLKTPADVKVVYGKIMYLSEQGEELYLSGASWDIAKRSFTQIPSIPHTATMHKRNLFEQYGRFDETFHIAGDYEMLLRELKTRNAMFIPNLVLAGMRRAGLSSHPNNSLLSMKEMRRAQKMHGFRFPGLLWINALLRVYVRLFLYKIVGDDASRQIIDYFRKIMGLPLYWTKI